MNTTVPGSPQHEKHTNLQPTSPLLVVSVQLGLLLLAIYYTFVGGQTSLGFYDPAIRAATHWLSAALVVCWLLWRWLAPHRTCIRALDLPILGLLLAWTIAALFSVDLGRSQETMVFAITYLFFFYMAADLARRPWIIELALTALLGAAGLMWTLALLQVSWWYAAQQAMPALLRDNGLSLSFSNLPRLSVLGNPNAMAAYLAPIAPLIWHKFTISSRRSSRALLALWGILVLGVLILTQSRGGLLGLSFALAYYGLTVARQRPQEGRSGSKWLKMGLAALAILLGLAVYGAIIRYGRGIGFQGNSSQVRLETMSGAVKILMAHPLTGSGPGTFGQELLRHQRPLRELHAHAHNLFLTFAAETGVLGILSMIWLIGAAFRQWRAAGRSRNQNSARPALQASLLAFIAHNMVDSLFEFPSVILLAAVIFGLWAGLIFQPRSLSPRLSRIVNLIAAIVLIAITVWGLRIARGLAAYNQAVRATVEDDWTAAAAHLQEAIGLSPQSEFYPRQLAFVYGYLSAQDQSYRPLAVAQYEKGLQSMGQFAPDRANFACLLWEDGERDRAIQEMSAACDLEPRESIYHLNLGRYLEAQGHYEEAWDEYARALSLQPEYLASGYWRQSAARQEHLPAILNRAVAQLLQKEGWPSFRQAELYVQAGDFSSAWAILEKTEQAQDRIHIGRAEVLLSTGEYKEAMAELEAAIELNPRAAWAYYYRSAIYLQQNRLSEAAHNTEAALFLASKPAFYYQSGQIAQAHGDVQEALRQYEMAVAQAAPSFSTRYALEAAKRQPLATGYLPCLIIPRPAEELRAQEKLEELCRQHPDSCKE